MDKQDIFSETTLLGRLQLDDKDAFSQLYNHHWEDLYVTASKAIRNKEDAADIVQEVFLSLWKRRKDIQIETSLAAYLHTSIRYKAVHYIEKNITRRDYIEKMTSLPANILYESAELKLHVKEAQKVVLAALNDMPPKMQTVYKLNREEHLSYKQIAERLNISSETVKKHLQHATPIIKTALEKAGMSYLVALLISILKNN